MPELPRHVRLARAIAMVSLTAPLFTGCGATVSSGDAASEVAADQPPPPGIQVDAGVQIDVGLQVDAGVQVADVMRGGIADAPSVDVPAPGIVAPPDAGPMVIEAGVAPAPDAVGGPAVAPEFVSV